MHSKWKKRSSQRYTEILRLYKIYKKKMNLRLEKKKLLACHWNPTYKVIKCVRIKC